MPAAPLPRRDFLKHSAALAAGVAGAFRVTAAHAAEFTLKYGNYQPMEHPNNMHAATMAAKINAESQGRIAFQVYPNSQLGSDMDMLSQLRSGAIDFMSLAPMTLGALLPVSQLAGVGFAFSRYDQVWPAMDGNVGALIRAQLAKRTTLFAFDKAWDNGFRQITASSHPIGSPADLRNMKMRVPPTPLLTSMFNALGASPTTVSMHDVYPSLQTHIVDAQENPLVLISASRIYEVQKYCSLTNHVWDGFWMLGNQQKFAKLPKDLQEIITRNVNEAALLQRADTARLNTSLVDGLRAKGLQFNDAPAEAFRQQLAQKGFYTQWRERFGNDAWAALEKYSGRMA